MREDICLLCGRQGSDVRMALVEAEEPDRMVDVRMPATHKEDGVEITVRVPERWYAVPRCRDEAGCQERVLELSAPEPVVQAEMAAEPEDPAAWL